MINKTKKPSNFLPRRGFEDLSQVKLIIAYYSSWIDYAIGW